MATRFLNKLLSKQKTLKIVKYGGSSLGNARSFEQCAAQLDGMNRQRHTNNIACVLSAMYGTTDALIKGAQAADKGDTVCSSMQRDKVMSLHMDTLRALPLSQQKKSIMEHYIRDIFSYYYDPSCSGLAKGVGDRNTHIALMSSIGERLSTRMMSSLLRECGTLAHPINADEVILTSSSSASSGATPCLQGSSQRIKSRIQPVLDMGGIPCITGFIGADIMGNTTTLGRGGSDLTATVLAYALEADEVVLSKVEMTKTTCGQHMAGWAPGFVGVVHAADPSKTVPFMTFEEAAELSHYARQVLHPATVFPCQEKEIPIRVVNTLDVSHPGTIIGNMDHATSLVCEATALSLEDYMKINGDMNDGASKAISSATIIAIVGNGIGHLEGMTREVVDVLESSGIHPLCLPHHLPFRSHSIAVAVNSCDTVAARARLYHAFVQERSAQQEAQSHAPYDTDALMFA